MSEKNESSGWTTLSIMTLLVFILLVLSALENLGRKLGYERDIIHWHKIEVPADE